MKKILIISFLFFLIPNITEEGKAVVIKDVFVKHDLEAIKFGVFQGLPERINDIEKKQEKDNSIAMYKLEQLRQEQNIIATFEMFQRKKNSSSIEEQKYISMNFLKTLSFYIEIYKHDFHNDFLK